MSARSLLLAALLAGVLAGCAAPTPQQLQAADAGRERLAELLGGLQQAVRDRSPEAIGPLLLPSMETKDKHHLQQRVEKASWLRFHQGYELDVEDAVSDVSMRMWRKHAFTLDVEASNSLGAEFENTFLIRREDDQWYLADFIVAQPGPGSAIVPPDTIKEPLVAVGGRVLELLDEGNSEAVYYMIPQETHLRWPKTTWWQRITGKAPRKAINVYYDLQVAETICEGMGDEEWPDAEADASYVFLPPNHVVLIYNIGPGWSGSELTKAANPLVMQLEFRPEDDGWQLWRLSLLGATIPWSQEP